VPYPKELAIKPRVRPVEAVVRPPGSKSITNRALIVASLAQGVSRLEDALEADDTEAMRDCLSRLGVMIDDVADPWLIRGTGGELSVPTGTLDARGSGTTARFVGALAALVPGEVKVDGNTRMRQRPIEELESSLRAMGARASSVQGHLPLTVHGGRLPGGPLEVDARRSSQFVSALLLVAPLAGSTTRLRLRDGILVSRPYVRSTVEVMRTFGAEVTEDEEGFLVEAGGYRAVDFLVEADASAAAYPLVAAAITGGMVAVAGIPAGSIQPDLALVPVLEEMGCTVRRGSDRLDLIGPAGPLRAIDIDLNQAPDAVLALAVAALFADGSSRLRNIGNLRHKETDRLAALETELIRVGARAWIEGDDLVVVPGPLRPAVVSTYNDHRMAMAFALVGLRQPGIIIADPGCVQKTWPGYFQMLAAL
jgi:3-phosphoshikimate 1-carboxyvinyltransferase